MTPRGILETVVYAPDLNAAAVFYRDVLELPLVSHEPGRDAFFRCGDAMLLIFNPHKTHEQDVRVNGERIPQHGSNGPGHIAFRASEAEIDVWKQRLTELGIEIESEVTWPRGGRSIYFRDPAGNCVEFATPALWGIDSD